MARLPILMYHNICKERTKACGLTISVENLEEQFKFLSNNGYKTLHFSELEQYSKANSLPKKSIIITFDDVYVSQLKFAVPLLKKYQLKASFFIPFAYVNGVDEWHTNKVPIMSVKDLKLIDASVVELGLHSFKHKKYHKMSGEAIETDFEKCKQFIAENHLDVKNILAYPYGKYPRNKIDKTLFFECLKKHNISYGLRIGNRVNTFPFKNNYEIQRIDIKGEDTLLKFKLKLRFGKLKLF